MPAPVSSPGKFVPIDDGGLVPRPTPKRLTKSERFSLWHFLDWKFEHYLTPWIIRTYWLLSLVAAALSLAILAITLIVSLLPESPRQERTVEHKLINPFQPDSQQTASEAATKFLYFALKTIGVVASLLFVRVFCETLIVIFNIAGSARAIENALASKSPP